MSNNILFICPNISGFYQDVIDEMTNQGYHVDYIYDEYKKNDPLYNRGHVKHYSKEEIQEFNNGCKKYWEEILNRPEYSKLYDYLLVVDGKGLHEVLFRTLRNRNPQIKTVNYLFDTVRSLYHFEENFHFFDSVYTFDKQDSEKYSIKFLPICWPKVDNSNCSIKYKAFAMGVYIPSRYEVFKFVYNIVNSFGYKSYIKTYYPKKKYYFLWYLWNIIKGTKPAIGIMQYYSKFITHGFISHSEFLRIMTSSDIVIDTINPQQDGLTARCTWALGNEKKIITNNASIATYDFYTPEQVYIIHDFSQKTRKEIESFIDKDFYMSEENRKKIAEFRIDNWVKRLLNE